MYIVTSFKVLRYILNNSRYLKQLSIKMNSVVAILTAPIKGSLYMHNETIKIESIYAKLQLKERLKHQKYKNT